MIMFERIPTVYNDGSGTMRGSILRAKVAGGWMCIISQVVAHGVIEKGSVFVPDPNHEWDGNSLNIAIPKAQLEDLAATLTTDEQKAAMESLLESIEAEISPAA